MPAIVANSEFRDILDHVALFPRGASVMDLLSLPEMELPRRTLQRRLDSLVSAGLLRVEGRARSTRYLLPQATTAPVRYPSAEEDVRPSWVVAETPAVYRAGRGWLSPEAEEIREALRKPLSERKAVGYRKEFLDAYEPNVTFYLPESMRRDLAAVGRVGMSELPAGTYLRKVLDRLIIDLSWNSSRLEGNTYSLLETERLLELGENAEGHGVEETLMILNHKAALEMLAEDAEQIGFNSYCICNLHALLADGLIASGPASWGVLRTVPVGIGGTVYHPSNVPQTIEECFARILQKADSIRDPFEQAFFAMVHLPYLQPFEDVNKRLSRVVANIPLIRQNLCPLSFVDVEREDYVGGLLGVYEMNRVEYLRDVFAFAYQRSCQRFGTVRASVGPPDGFRMRHRALLGDVIREVVNGGMDKRRAAAHIASTAEGSLPANERAKFVELVETELGFLREHNIARFRLRPSQFTAWHAAWK